jgi:hypothetical protein
MFKSEKLIHLKRMLGDHLIKIPFLELSQKEEYWFDLKSKNSVLGVPQLAHSFTLEKSVDSVKFEFNLTGNMTALCPFCSLCVGVMHVWVICHHICVLGTSCQFDLNGHAIHRMGSCCFSLDWHLLI